MRHTHAVSRQQFSIRESNKPTNFFGRFLKLNIGLYRHDIVGMRVAGEAASVDLDVVNNYRATLPKILENFAADDIYNADETALFFKCLPSKTLAYKGTNCHGDKANKERVTIMPICNMSGETQTLFSILKSSFPFYVKLFSHSLLL